MPEIAETYTIPVILSFRDTAKQAERDLGGRKIGAKFGQQIAGGMKSAESDIKRATESYSKLYDKHADALGKVKAAQAALNQVQKSGNDARIVAASQKLEKAKRDEARALRAATDGYKEYEAAAKSAANAADKVGDGLATKLSSLGGKARSSGGDAATSFVEGFGGPIAAIGTRTGPVGAALTAVVGLGTLAGGALATQILAGMEQQQQRANVAAKLGLAPDQMKPIADAAAKAYASNFGESVAANMETARVAIQSGLINPNATKAEVQAMVQQLDTVSQVLGEDIPATARAAQQAIRTGIAGSATDAFDLFVKAQQSGLNVSEDFLDTINEYGTQFRKLGLDGPEAVGLLSQAVRGGARDTDVAADALKEFSIRAVDGTELTAEAFTSLGFDWEAMAAKFAAGGTSAHDAFDQVVDAVRGIKDPVEQSRIAVALFGTQAEDLGGALNAFDLSTAVDQLGQVDGAAQDAADTMGGTASSSMESLKRTVVVAADDIQDALAESFGPEIKKWADAATANKPKITEFFADLGIVVIQATENVAQGIGGMLQAFGDLIGGLGNVKGTLDSTMAFFADLRGDDAGAEAFRKSAQEAFGWGEDLRAAGDKLAAIELDPLKDSLHNIADEAGTGAGKVDGLTDAINRVPPKATTIFSITDGLGNEIPFEAYLGIANAPPPPGTTVVPGAGPQNPLDVIAPGGPPLSGLRPGGGGRGVGINLQIAAGSGTSKLVDSGSRPSVPNAQNAAALLSQLFPGIASIGGSDNRPPGTPQMHTQGRALDIMIGEVNAQNQAMGDQINAWLRANKDALGLESTIWRDTWQDFAGNQSTEEGHQNHVHAQFAAGQSGLGAGAGAVSSSSLWDEIAQAESSGDWANNNSGGHQTSSGAPRGGLQITDGTWAAFGGTEFAPTANLATKEQQIAVAERIAFTGYNGQPPQGLGAWEVITKGMTPNVNVNTPQSAFGSSGSVFGAGYQPGIGTAGYNDQGEPGYYLPDPTEIREAEQRIADQQERVREAEVAAADARAAKAELDITASEREKAAAEERIRKADNDIEVAKRELQDTKGELGEAKRGKFTAAEAAKQQKAGKGGAGGMGLGGLGSIASSFLTETFGFGSWLPSLDNLLPVQIADTLLGTFVPQILSGSDTSGGVQAPELPIPWAGGGTPGGGIGAGAGQNISIDQSIHGNVGWDPEEVKRQRDAGLARAIPRIPPGP